MKNDLFWSNFDCSMMNNGEVTTFVILRLATLTKMTACVPLCGIEEIVEYGWWKSPSQSQQILGWRKLGCLGFICEMFHTQPNCVNIIICNINK